MISLTKYQIPLLVIVLLTLLIQGLAVSAEFIAPADRVYGYKVELLDVGIVPRYVKVIDSSRVLVAGSIGDGYGVVLLNIADPYSKPVIEDLYPLTGSPTYITTDGYPVTRIAVGSDKGEVLVFRVDRGRLTKHLYVVLGADFYVDKLALARDANGDIKIIVLVAEGGSRGYPCLNCYVYVLDEEAQGILRIGPRVGNATVLGRDLEGIHVQDFAPLTVYGGKSFYKDASNVIVAYIPQVLKLVLRISYIEGVDPTARVTPLNGTLVEVRLAPRGAPAETIVYGVNADRNGVARIPVPIEKHRTLVINLTIRDVAGTPIWQYTYILDPVTLRNILMITDEIPLPPVILTTRYVDTRDAAKVYGIPPFLAVRLDLLDLTLAPIQCREIGCIRKGSANFYLNPTVTDILFLKGEAEARAKVVYGDPSAGSIGIATVSVGRGITRLTSVEDYVGTGIRVIDCGTYSTGSYTLVGLSDGRIRVYVPEGPGHRLRYIYPMGSKLINIVSIPGLEGYTYVAISSDGIQIFRIEPYPMPIYRALTYLHLTAQGFIHGDVLPDTTTVALVDARNVFIVKNSDIAIRNRLIMSMDKFMARDVELQIALPKGEDINRTEVVFRYPNGVIRYILNRSNIVTLKNIIPGITYTVDIYPPKPYIYPSSITLRLVDGPSIEIISSDKSLTTVGTPCCRLTVNMMYKEYTIKLLIADEISGYELIAPLDIYIDNTYVTSITRGGGVYLNVLYGDRNITIIPQKEFEKTYIPYSSIISVYGDVEANIILRRTRHQVYMKIVDEFTKDAPIAPLLFELAGMVHVIYPGEHVFNIILPYGNYTARLRPAEGYENVYQSVNLTLSIPKITSYSVELRRILYNVELILRDAYTGRLIAPLNIYINGTLLRANTTEHTHVLSVPYGPWIIRLEPSKGYEKVYDIYELEVYINGSQRLYVDVPRSMYTISINVVDIYGTVIIPLDVVIEGPIKVLQKVEPPGKPIFLLLPFGEYKIDVIPYNTSIYVPYTTSLLIDSSQNIALTIQRVRYRLELNLVDRFGLRGRFMLYVNGTKLADNIGRSAEIRIPYGTYTIQLVPMTEWETAYEPSRPMTIAINGDTSITIHVNRKLYDLRITVLEGTTPISNAAVYIYSLETGEIITTLITDPGGVMSTPLPYGVYRLVIKHPQYKDAEIPTIVLDTNRGEIVYLEPSIQTIILRYLPTVLTLIGVGVAVYIAMKIRARIARRLIEEEMF